MTKKETSKSTESTVEKVPSQISETKTKKHSSDKKDLLNTFGASGTSLVEGYILEEYNPKLAWSAGLLVYEKMRKSDAQVFATLLAMELPIRSTKWDIMPASDENGETGDREHEIADFVRKALFEKMETPFDDLLREVLTMLPFGFSLFEKVWTADSKYIWLKKLASRKQNSIHKWQQLDRTAGVQQILPQTVIEWVNAWLNLVSIPASKLLLFSFRREGENYEGVSVLRSAYKHWYFKETMYKFDAVRHERQSVGIPVIYLPSSATPEDKEQAKIIVANIRATEQTGVVMPWPKEDGWLFEFADMKSGQSTNLFESIKHHNREIAKNILAQFLELGDTESGSKALSEDQSDLFLLSLVAVANQIKDTINRFLIPELVDYNFDDVKEYPKLTFEKLGVVDYEKIANILSSLASSELLTKDEDLEDYLRTTLNLPARKKDEGTDDDSEDDETGGVQKKDTPENPEPTPKETIQKEIIDEKEEEKFHEHGPDCNHEKIPDDAQVFFDASFLGMSRMFNNKFIVELQNECRTADDYARLKQKGFKFNDYEKEAFRPMTFSERKVNFVSLKRSMETFEKILQDNVDSIIQKQREDILKQIKKAVDSNDIAAVGTIKAKYTADLSQALTDVQKEMFEIWKKSAAVEMSVQVPATKAEVRGAMRVQNDAMIEWMVNDMEVTAKKAATQVINKNGGSITTTSSSEAVAAAWSSIDKVMTGQVNTLKTLGITGSVNLGRSSIFERYPEKIYWFQFSAILDSSTTQTCRSLDGRVVKAWSREFYDYAPPRHYGCRSIWVEILNEESFKPEFTWIPSSIPANQTIETFKDIKAPIVLKWSPVMTVIQKELDETREKLKQLEISWKYKNRADWYRTRIAELEKSLQWTFSEYCREVLIADGISFKEVSE